MPKMTLVSFSFIFHSSKEVIKDFMYNNTKQILEKIFKGEYDKKNPLASFRDIVPGTQLITLNKNDVLIAQHDPVKYAYFLLRGHMSVLNLISWSNDNVVDSLEPLDIVGFIEYLNNTGNYTAYVVADTKCVLYRLPVETFADIIRRDAFLCYQTLVVFGKIAESNMSRAEVNCLFSQRDVLGHYLFLQAEKAKSLPYICPFTRAALAEKLHINLRTLYRHIDFMKENGFLTSNRGKIIIEEKHFESLSERYGNIVL